LAYSFFAVGHGGRAKLSPANTNSINSSNCFISVLQLLRHTPPFVYCPQQTLQLYRLLFRWSCLIEQLHNAVRLLPVEFLPVNRYSLTWQPSGSVNVDLTDDAPLLANL